MTDKTEWQPIETAPKNAIIIAWHDWSMAEKNNCPPSRIVFAEWRVQWNGNYWLVVDFQTGYKGVIELHRADTFGKLTHWLPMPTPPKI